MHKATTKIFQFPTVTIDFGRNKSADTGGFEVVHQIKMSERRNTIDDISAQVLGGKLFEKQSQKEAMCDASLIEVAT